MEIYLARQTVWFLSSVLLGVLFGIGWTIYDLVQTAVGITRTKRFWADVLLFFTYGVITFLFAVVFQSGELRIYPWAGIGMGAFLEVQIVGGAVENCKHRLRRGRAGKYKQTCKRTFRRISVKMTKKR